MTRDPYCDCGTCCDTCGHDADCTSRLIRAAETGNDQDLTDYLLARAPRHLTL